MKCASYDYIIKTVTDTNILPVTSSCVTGCVFCSHGNNPRGVEVYKVPELTMDDISDIARYLDGSRKIIIGESASRIIEGEPFLREDMMDILSLLRTRYPDTLIEITTNGSYLNTDIINGIKRIGNIEMNISLNSSTKEGRKSLYRGGIFPEAVDAMAVLKESGILFNGSIVALPDVVGYQDIEDTISYLSCNGAQTVRVFVPGFSRLSRFNIDFFAIRLRLHEIADAVYEKYNVPVLIEPPLINNLDAEICGIIKNSAAMDAGLKKGDIITSVNGVLPFCRVDAYNLLSKYKNPEVSVTRLGSTFKTLVRKSSSTSSGAVFYYDINPDLVDEIQKAANKNRAVSPLVVTSELGCEMLGRGMEKAGADFDILAVKNTFFGGTIMCAGLLAAEDIIRSIECCAQRKTADLVIVPAVAFDTTGRDICGHYYYEIEDRLNIKTVVAE